MKLRVVDVDLDDLVADEARRLRAQTSLRVTTRIEAVRVLGDPDRIARALRNLVDNAARFAGAQVRLGVARAQGCAVVLVEDDGPGIRAADREAVLRRFVRLDEHRARNQGGAGLGLAIADEILALHGGACVVGDSDLGGAQVSLRLPLAPVVTVTGSRR
ncbi:MAG: ATP-binding protein [Candidatus Nanopelagicales bacterium]